MNFPAHRVSIFFSFSSASLLPTTVSWSLMGNEGSARLTVAKGDSRKTLSLSHTQRYTLSDRRKTHPHTHKHTPPQLSSTAWQAVVWRPVRNNRRHFNCILFVLFATWSFFSALFTWGSCGNLPPQWTSRGRFKSSHNEVSCWLRGLPADVQAASLHRVFTPPTLTRLKLHLLLLGAGINTLIYSLRQHSDFLSHPVKFLRRGYTMSLFVYLQGITSAMRQKTKRQVATGDVTWGF